MRAVKEWLIDNKWLLLVVLLVVQSLFLMMQWIFPMSDKEESDEVELSSLLLETPMIEESWEEEEPESLEESHTIWIVDIKGAVQRPGIYQVNQEMRIYDAIQLAGGLTDGAVTKHLNFAQHLSDQMLIYVPLEGEEVDLATVTTDSTPGQLQQQSNKININTADTSQLQELNGIGQKKAEMIIQYREDVGLFSKIEDLMNVSGIGSKTFEAIADKITISNN
ncbi:hypothetical protein BW721_04460 [Jeotgalibaca sp. PTS2502]|uniref:helix-hairpin-helix domain-containing protein n=1 Tax=Jeotgalibaca sp. PTS2502 TaxID=1903686 RepID=UPI000973A652|nr:helix-hairpin-helix domain-containing protein [Jeotgalibaca sp. PTS2502]APZ48994.1 hypothetical protein BW721_04460 [Jeotgalibaca sp. PTS2502]